VTPAYSRTTPGTIREKVELMRLPAVIAVLTFAALPLMAAETPLRVVPTIDLTRYAGTWYEIARLPNRFQEKCAGEVAASYALRPDGRITVSNRCRTAEGETTMASGVARRVDGKPPSMLEVRFAPAFLSFLPAVWGDYQVIALGADYDHAMVGTPDRAYLWVLSRTPQMDPALYRWLLDDARSQGFDISKVVETRQQPGS
jgi:apolipoprotein D and lipocalin family protein